MRSYVERYEYDAVGNILRLVHQAGNGSWARDYSYNEPSLIDSAKTGNRLSSTTTGNTTEAYRHDEHGNIAAMAHLPAMSWDSRDRLCATANQVRTDGGTPETTYYTYDAPGMRVRKVTDRQSAPSNPPRRMKERIYLGAFEIYREYAVDGTTVSLERQSVHIMDDKQRVAVVETRTVGSDPAPATLTRYQLGNQLGSVSIELDDTAQLISYEEYSPYGSSSYQAVRSQTETPKLYRYTGKERDEENGLYYHGARYYAPWLGRWASCDPGGFVDGLNLYEYTRGSPVRFSDPSGFGKEEQGLGTSMENASETHQNAANDVRELSGKARIEVRRQKGVGGKREVIPDEVKKTPGGTKKVIETKARHVGSARNNSASLRQADIRANLEQVKEQLVALEKAGEINSTTKGAVLRVIHDSDKGVSSTEAVAAWRQEASAVREQWIGEAANDAEKALRSRVWVTTTTRAAYTRATENLAAKSAPHGRTGAVIGLAIAAYILFDTGDAYAAAQSVNPVANTTDVFADGNITLLGVAEAVLKDAVSLHPVGAVTMLMWTLMQPRGDFLHDEKLAKRAIEEGRNPFCAQCHGPGGALDPNNEWNRRAQLRDFERLRSQFGSKDMDAVKAYLFQQPQ
jgi:RHS repeat-associated protein